ncbi:permease prefix domain 1-containing protein [Microbacterium sp.]|uniref:permease prefix domain 1-containing protein n=1 Tax=Microbacterium sp. TaxID=51671 RepID=UPI0027377910|nr:permease prefix domain 1-containing protein [Microbacterium sp.]MDP3950029.1 permease prefix domain 1-containing protein [Microbacterium sp.]
MTATMSSSLTERYIAATVKSITPTAQDDVRAELAASIDDAIEARLDQGEPRDAAERAVLTELGDPGILAASYADRPLHLIGPRYYLTWWRLLKLLLWIVPPFAAFGVALAQVLSGATVGEVIGQVVAVTISVVVHLVFWTTLVFFVLERTGADTGVRWDVDQLPEPVVNGVGRADLIASLGFLVIGVGAIFWDRFLGFFPTGADPIPVLNPGLWPWGITILFALIVAEVLLAVAIYASGRWNMLFAWINTALAIAFAVWALTLLARGELINPAFLDFVVSAGGEGFARGDAGTAEQGGLFRVLAVVTGVCLVAFPVWDIIDGWLKTYRARRQA